MSANQEFEQPKPYPLDMTSSLPAQYCPETQREVGA